MSEGETKQPGAVKSKGEQLEDMLRHCLFNNSEIIMAAGEIPSTAILVEGVVSMYGLNPDRLEEKREEVVEFIKSTVPTKFLVDHEGGASFLELCRDKDGEQWTSLHKVMEALVCLAMGLDLAGWCAPQAMWDSLPGGMPYVWFRTDTETEVGVIPVADAVETKPTSAEKATLKSHSPVAYHERPRPNVVSRKIRRAQKIHSPFPRSNGDN